MRNPSVVVKSVACQILTDRYSSVMTVKTHPCRAIRLPTPKITSIRKNNIENS